MNIKLCMGHILGTWELLLCEYWRKGMIIGEKNTDLKRLTGRLKLRFLTEIGRFHWNQGEEVAHFAWFGEPWESLWLIILKSLNPPSKKSGALTVHSVYKYVMIRSKHKWWVYDSLKVASIVVFHWKYSSLQKMS